MDFCWFDQFETLQNTEIHHNEQLKTCFTFMFFRLNLSHQTKKIFTQFERCEHSVKNFDKNGDKINVTKYI